MGWEVDCPIIKHANHKFIRKIIFEELSERPLSPRINNHFSEVHKIILSHYENCYILECLINNSGSLRHNDILFEKPFVEFLKCWYIIIIYEKYFRL